MTYYLFTETRQMVGPVIRSSSLLQFNLTYSTLNSLYGKEYLKNSARSIEGGGES